MLVDVGISCKEVEKRMGRLGLSILKVKAIFISHEHSDHIKGVQTLSKKYNIPVYITPSTLNNSHLVLENVLIKSFKAYEKIIIGNLSAQTQNFNNIKITIFFKIIILLINPNLVCLHNIL